jgi:hypothetical protein
MGTRKPPYEQMLVDVGQVCSSSPHPPAPLSTPQTVAHSGSLGCCCAGGHGLPLCPCPSCFVIIAPCVHPMSSCSQRRLGGLCPLFSSSSLRGWLVLSCWCHPHLRCPSLSASSTRNPPRKQWLAGLGVGAGSFVPCRWVLGGACRPVFLSSCCCPVFPSPPCPACFVAGEDRSSVNDASPIATPSPTPNTGEGFFFQF